MTRVRLLQICSWPLEGLAGSYLLYKRLLHASRVTTTVPWILEGCVVICLCLAVILHTRIFLQALVAGVTLSLANNHLISPTQKTDKYLPKQFAQIHHAPAQEKLRPAKLQATQRQPD